MSLTEIGLKYGTDKAHPHYFTDFYSKYFEPIRYEPLTILELGVANGASIKMWKEYFPNASIVGVDLYRSLEDDLQFSFIQQDHVSFANDNLTMFDIIIEDGSHVTSEQVALYQKLKRFVKPNGFYICEDLHTSFMPEYINEINAYEFFEKEGFAFFKKLDETAGVDCITSIKQL